MLARDDCHKGIANCSIGRYATGFFCLAGKNNEEAQDKNRTSILLKLALSTNQDHQRAEAKSTWVCCQ